MRIIMLCTLAFLFSCQSDKDSLELMQSITASQQEAAMTLEQRTNARVKLVSASLRDVHLQRYRPVADAMREMQRTADRLRNRIRKALTRVNRSMTIADYRSSLVQLNADLLGVNDTMLNIYSRFLAANADITTVPFENVAARIDFARSLLPELTAFKWRGQTNSQTEVSCWLNKARLDIAIIEARMIDHLAEYSSGDSMSCFSYYRPEAYQMTNGQVFVVFESLASKMESKSVMLNINGKPVEAFTGVYGFYQPDTEQSTVLRISGQYINQSTQKTGSLFSPDPQLLEVR